MDGLIALLPFALLFLVCPLMMLFMHRGQDHHTDDRAELPQPRGGGSTASATSEGRTPPTAPLAPSGLSVGPQAAASFGSGPTPKV